MKRNFSHVARYSLKIHSLLVNCCKITRYSFQKSLVVKNHSLLAAKVARCKKLLVTRCKIHSLLVEKVESPFATILKSAFSTGVFL